MSRVSTTIRNRRDDFFRVVDAVDRFAGEHHIPSDIVGDVQVALDEILANIVNYGYSDHAEHEICVCLKIANHMLEVMVEDDGVPFNPLKSGEPDIHAPLHERRTGGIGLHFVKNLMIEVTYERVGRYNRLVLKKELSV